jgi:hypothetical protein
MKESSTNVENIYLLLAQLLVKKLSDHCRLTLASVPILQIRVTERAVFQTVTVSAQ